MSPVNHHDGERLDGVLRRTRDPVLVYASVGGVADANAAARDALPPAALDVETGDDAYRDAVAAVRRGDRDDARCRLDLESTAYDARLTPVADDAPRAVCAVLRDVSDADDRVEDLALLNRVLRHDVRNHATAVAGWADSLRGRVTDDGEDALDHIVDAAEDVLRTTDTARQLVDVSLGVATRSVAVGPALDRSVAAVQREHPDARVDAPAVADDVRVRATPLLDSVLYNLLSNAVRHDPDPDSHVVVTVDAGSDRVAISVADDGPGIPPERRDAVFEHGERGPDSDGDGVGLYLVERSVAAFGGRVDLAVNDPTGSVFTVTLDRA